MTRDLTNTSKIKRDREEKQIKDSQRFQLALLARILFRSEKQSIEKNICAFTPPPARASKFAPTALPAMM